MDRRSTERYPVWFPITVITDDGQEGTAITYDVSESGLLMACPGRLEEGVHVTLRFKVSTDEDERSVGAQIVRVEENEGEEGPWRFRMAAHYDELHPELAGVLERHAEEPR